MDLMIDLETAGTGPEAAILSIGACFFDPSKELVDETFYVNVDLNDCLSYDMKVDGGTFYWWLEQSKEVQEAVSEDREPLLVALHGLQIFINEGCNYDLDNLKVWAWPPSFDLVIINSALRLTQFGGIGKPFWNRRNERDARTFVMSVADLCGVDAQPARDHGTKHNALDDAIGQALAVQTAYRAVLALKQGMV